MNETPLPLDGLGNQQVRLAVARLLQAVQRNRQRRDVMAVDALDLPAERGELIAQIAGLADVDRRAVDLQAVRVQDGHQVVDALVDGERRSLPHLALLRLAIAQDGEHGVVVALQAQAARKAARNGQALAQ